LYLSHTQPTKTKQVNIGTTKNPKFVHIGDYWNNDTIEKVVEFLREYQDLFPTTLSEIKGTAGDLGEMKIPLNPRAKTIQQRPYKLNPRYKEKVKDEIDKILDAGIIELVEEFEWIIPMVVQENDIGGIRICVDLRKLNDTCLHDPFQTSFIDEEQENVGGQEAYPFTDGFYGYHEIKIM
jgi:hypothetical protein